MIPPVQGEPGSSTPAPAPKVLPPLVLLNGKHLPKIEDRLLSPRGHEGTYPAWEGLPFRGKIPDLREDDPDYKQPQIGSEAHVTVYDLSNPEHLEHYQKVWQLIANGTAMLSAEERVYDPEIKNWRVFMRWADSFTFAPKPL